MRRSQSWHSTALLLLLLTFVSFACKPTPAPPPPPPPPAASAPAAPPAPVIPAPTLTLTASAQTIVRGGSVTLTWTTTNATTLDIQPEIGSVTPVASGTRQVSPTSSVTYSATATGPGGTRPDTVRITVNDPPPPPPPVAPRGNQPPPPPPPTLTTQQLIDRNMLPINFDYDMSDIREDQKSKLQTEATFLKANTNIRLVVEGHADERGSEQYNLALGDRRANAVKQYFISQGIAEARLFTVSYGEERPVCSAQTEECFAMNRRAAFRINP